MKPSIKDTMKYPITLTPDERTLLQRLVNKGTGNGRSYLRIQILLLAHDTDASDAEIAALLHTSHDTVYRTRKKCVERGVLSAITERPRSGAPCRLNEASERLVLALAYSDPPAGHATWTMQLLADKLVDLGEVDRISDETVRLTLKKMRPSPGSSSAG